MKIKSWILILNLEPLDFYKFESTKWDVTDDELSMCIQEQIYGDRE